MKHLYQLISGFMAYFILLFYLLVVVFLLLTNFNQSLNNQLHRYLTIWPEVGNVGRKSQLLTVRKSDFGEIKEQFISIKSQSPELKIVDGPSSNPLTFEADYYRLSDEVILTNNLDEQGLLSIWVRREGESVDLPPQPLALAKYEAKLGNLEVPTHLYIKTLSGPVDIQFEKKGPSSIEIETEAGDYEMIFSTTSLPLDGILITTEEGDFEISLPRGNGVQINYELGPKAKIKVGEEVQRGGVGTISRPGVAVVPITIKNAEGDLDVGFE